MDPLSLAANIAGLVIFIKEVKQISEKIYDTVKGNPQLLRRITDDLDAVRSVLERLERCLNGRSKNEDDAGPDHDALSAILQATKNVVSEIFQELSTLREAFSRTALRRLMSYNKFKRQMERLTDHRVELTAFKSTLSLALQMRTLGQIPESTSMVVAEISTLRRELSQLSESGGQALWIRPIQQYVSVSSGIITNNSTKEALLPPHSTATGSTNLNSVSVSLSTSSPALGKDSHGEDLDNVLSFDSFESWLASFAPAEHVAVVDDAPTSMKRKRAEDQEAEARGLHILDGRDIKFVASNLHAVGSTDDGLPDQQILNCKPLDTVSDLVHHVHSLGYHHICGFKIGSHVLAPAVPIRRPIPLYVTRGQSTYDTNKIMSINQDEPLERYYDALARGGLPATRPKILINDGKIYVNHNETSRHWYSGCQVTFNRTIRVPEDGTKYNLPAWTGEFPAVSTSKFAKRVPKSMAAKRGMLVPIYQREALSIGLHSGTPRRPIAVKVLAGGVNVVSGSIKRSQPSEHHQDYVVSTAQQRVDGFFAKAGVSVVRQFVSMPLGQEFTAEHQLTGAENIGGIQFVFAAPFLERGEFRRSQDGGDIPVGLQSKSPSQLGIKDGSCLFVTGPLFKNKFSGYKLDKALLVREDSAEKSESVSSRPTRDDYENGERPVAMHEALLPLLPTWDGLGSGSLPLEPVAFWTVSVTTVKSSDFIPGIQPLDFKPDTRYDINPKAVEYTVSPFLKPDDFLRMVERKLGYTEIVLLCDDRQLRKGQGHKRLYEVIEHGASLLCQGYRAIVHVSVSLSLLGSAGREQMTRNVKLQGSWEMGLAPGGTIFQDIYVDLHPESWNWAAASVVNVQMVNAIAWKAVAGTEAQGQQPLSFQDYLRARIPFYHFVSQNQNIGSQTLARLSSVGQIDAERGIVAKTNVCESSTVTCALCEQNLADTLLRPCNHVFCRRCVVSKMTTKAMAYCAACLEPATHQISFSAPMEAPNATLEYANTGASSGSVNGSEREDSVEHVHSWSEYRHRAVAQNPRIQSAVCAPKTAAECRERLSAWLSGYFSMSAPIMDPSARWNISALVYFTRMPPPVEIDVGIRDPAWKYPRILRGAVQGRADFADRLLPEMDLSGCTDESLSVFMENSRRGATGEGIWWDWWGGAGVDGYSVLPPPWHRVREAQQVDTIGERIKTLLWLVVVASFDGEEGTQDDGFQDRFGTRQLNTRPEQQQKRLSRIVKEVMRILGRTPPGDALRPLLEACIRHGNFEILDMIMEAHERPKTLSSVVGEIIGRREVRKSHVRSYLIRRYGLDLPELDQDGWEGQISVIERKYS